VDEILSIMLSWAVTLSGYPAPAHIPVLEMVPHSFMVERACRGLECHVQGWFPGGQTIYIDKKLDPRTGLYDSSVLLHELVHYLQQESQAPGTHTTCSGNVASEREAYGAQREYLLRYGEYMPVGSSMHNVSC
jgi:hypothetical protein